MFYKTIYKAGYTLRTNTERIANENSRCYHSINVYAKANVNRTFDSRSVRFPHEVAHQRQFAHARCAICCCSLLFAAIHYRTIIS